MKKLVLIALAAGAAALPSGALAQVAHGGGASISHGGNVSMRHGGGRFMHPGPNFRHHRLQRGFFVHPFWFGPQFHVQNWQLYGFPAPAADQRWVRHYDDAYLIDREGRVQDTRYGLDWDEYGERWEIDEGIPSYYGRGEWRPDERDYAWVESQGPGAGYAHAPGPGPGPGAGYPPPPGCQPSPYPCGQDHAYGHGGESGPGYAPGPACQPSPYPCGQGYGYGAGYGYYGYGVAYPIIIETTVSYGGGCCAATACCYEEVVTEEVVEVRQPRRYHRPQPRPRPRPRPPAGERG